MWLITNTISAEATVQTSNPPIGLPNRAVKTPARPPKNKSAPNPNSRGGWMKRV